MVDSIPLKKIASLVVFFGENGGHTEDKTSYVVNIKALGLSKRKERCNGNEIIITLGILGSSFLLSL